MLQTTNMFTLFVVGFFYFNQRHIFVLFQRSRTLRTNLYSCRYIILSFRSVAHTVHALLGSSLINKLTSAYISFLPLSYINTCTAYNFSYIFLLYHGIDNSILIHNLSYFVHLHYFSHLSSFFVFQTTKYSYTYIAFNLLWPCKSSLVIWIVFRETQGMD